MQFAIGLSTGFYFANANEQEAATKKGKNDYLASLFQASQVSGCSTVAKELCSAIPHPVLKSSLQVSFSLISLSGWAACPLFAAIKQGHYTGGVESLKAPQRGRIATLASHLPDKISENAKKISSYLADNLGPLATKTMTGAVFALPLIGNPYLATGIIIPVGYRNLDAGGYVPRKISLEMEKYLPAIASVGALLSDPISQLIGSIYLLSFSPAMRHKMLEKLDLHLNQWIGLSGPSLEEINAPLIENKELAFERIMDILNALPGEITVNPTHCSNPILGFNALAKSEAFTEFLNLFDTVNWEEKYTLLKNYFRDDERFIDELKKGCDQTDGGEIRKHFEEYLSMFLDKGEQEIIPPWLFGDTLQKEPILKQQFLAEQLRKQMVELVNMLNGKRREGSQKDADEAIHYCGQILHYLLNLDLNAPAKKIILEDILMKLGIDGGEYCALGVKIASKQIVDGLIQESLTQETDLVKYYESRLLLKLEAKRTQLVDEYYTHFINALVSAMKNKNTSDTDSHAASVAQDVHTLAIYRLPIALGVVPLTEYERDSIGLGEFNLWFNPTMPFREFRNNIYFYYQHSIDQIIEELGHLDFAIYIRAVIEQNSKLNEEEKEAILEVFTEENAQKRFNRLACVMLGILNYKENLKDHWVDVPVPEPKEEVQDGEWLLVNDT